MDLIIMLHLYVFKYLCQRYPTILYHVIDIIRNIQIVEYTIECTNVLITYIKEVDFLKNSSVIITITFLTSKCTLNFLFLIFYSNILSTIFYKTSIIKYYLFCINIKNVSWYFI